MSELFWAVLVILAFRSIGSYGYAWTGMPTAKTAHGRLQTRLLAHHVNKKITKRMMDRRPKKSRPSDIFRNNVNHNKCITKIEGAPSEYTLVSSEGFAAERAKILQFWESGDPDTPWLELVPEEVDSMMCPNIEPPPPGTRRKPLKLPRSGSL